MSADGSIPLSCLMTTMEAGDAVILILLILLSAFFSAAEMAVVSLNDKKIEKLAEEGNKRAQKLNKMLCKPGRFLTTVQIGSHMANVSAGAFIAVKVSPVLKVPPILHMLLLAVVTIVASWLIALLGDMLPKRLAAEHSEEAAMRYAYPLSAVSVLIYPVVKALQVLTRLLAWVFGVRTDHTSHEVTEEEIRLMVDVGEEKGVIPETEKMMINNIFEFNDITVNKIMTHRTDVVAVSKDTPFEEIVKIAAEEGYSRLPVYDGTLDNIRGVIHVKSLLEYVAKGTFDLEGNLLQPYFVPESKMANELFEDMQKNKVHIAIVVDEYGGTAGIITMEDLIESILGNIQDEYDDEENDTEMVDEHTFLVDGSAEFGMVCDMVDLDMPEGADNEYDYETIGGFVTDMLDKIPEKGDQFEFEQIRFEVVDADDRKIQKIRVTKLK